MKLYDYSFRTLFETAEVPKKYKGTGELFILCKTHEVPSLRNVFEFDESTVIDCTDLDESVRYTSFDGYDFISVVHIEIVGSEFRQREINIYVSKRYLVLVMPEHDSPRLSEMETRLINAVKAAGENAGRINTMYFLVFHYLLSDFSDTMEVLEDNMQALSDDIVINLDTEHFSQINTFKNMAYTLKKQLRALSYLGDQILLDENKLITKAQTRYFHNVATRLKKLYDFAENLYNLSSEILYTYDSRLTMKTNDTVNKLTALTLFFGPLTVITGIYGMNFSFMPELGWRFGYPIVLIVMTVISAVMYFILKKNKWL